MILKSTSFPMQDDPEIGTLPRSQAVSDETLAHLSPLKWEHINLTGDYHWRKDAGLQDGKLRPLRVSSRDFSLACNF
jgi:hypothetical protein